MIDNDTLIENIRKLMEDKGIKQKDLVEYLGVNQGTLAKWLSTKKDNRRDIPIEILAKIAKFLGVSVEYLLGLEKKPVKTVPLIGNASCGIPNDYDLNGYEPIPVSNELYHDKMYAVRAEGDSMSPKINDRNLVYCVPDIQIENGDIVHYTLNGESGIKKFKINEKGDIISLVPLNSDYDIITIHADDNVEFAMSKVVGAVDTDF